MNMERTLSGHGSAAFMVPRSAAFPEAPPSGTFLDVLLAVGLFWTGALALRGVPETFFEPRGAMAFAVILAATTLPLALRRQAPLFAISAVAVSLVLASILNVPTGIGSYLGAFVAVHGYASFCRRRLGWVGWLLIAGPLFLIVDPGRVGWAEPGITLLLLAGAAWYGELQWQRRHLADVAATAPVPMESEPQTLGRLAVAEERWRVASEFRTIAVRSIETMVARAREAFDELSASGVSRSHLDYPARHSTSCPRRGCREAIWTTSRGTPARRWSRLAGSSPR